MTVEILPPLPGSGKKPDVARPEGRQEGFAYGGTGGFKIVRVPPLLAGLLAIPFLLILLIILPVLLLASLVFGFRIWRRVVALSGMTSGTRGSIRNR